MSDKYFDIERDNRFPYFCQACAVGKEQMSQRDIRYCLECQPIVEEGYASLGQHKRYLKQLYNQKLDSPNNGDRENYTNKEKTKLSTLEQGKITVDNFRPRGRPKTYKKRSLPGDKIKQLHKEGMGAKAIATQLKREQGMVVSYKTIQRVLSGERN